MTCIAKYIQNKKIDISKSNDIKDLEGISKATWKLISFIYNSGWNLLIADDYKNSLRQRIASKFTSKVILEKNSKKGEKDTNKPARIEKISPLIPAKSLKEVKEISKYFKPIIPTKNNNSKNKSYAQASKTSSNTKEVLKIKEAFLSLKAKNIDNIQKIINGNNNSKPKPHINIIIKEPSLLSL